MKLDELRTTRSDDCLSDLRLDALALGELDAEQVEQAEQHVSECRRCAERRQWLGESTRASAEVIALRPLRTHSPAAPLDASRRSRRAWLGSGFAVLAAAAAVLLLLVRQPLQPSLGSVRTKGTSRVGFFVRHAEAVRRGGVPEHVAPGDALRFVVTSPVPIYVAVLSRDGAGQVSVYHPAGPRALRVEPGVERPLDASVVLDGVLGEERLYALTCSTSIELRPLVEALKRAGDEPRWPPECSLERFVLIKNGSRP